MPHSPRRVAGAGERPRHQGAAAAEKHRHAPLPDKLGDPLPDLGGQLADLVEVEPAGLGVPDAASQPLPGVSGVGQPGGGHSLAQRRGAELGSARLADAVDRDAEQA